MKTLSEAFIDIKLKFVIPKQEIVSQIEQFISKVLIGSGFISVNWFTIPFDNKYFVNLSIYMTLCSL